MKFAGMWLVFSLRLWSAQNVDVVVYGGTPGGIAAAIAAARLGHTVALIEYHAHLGGMSSSGLGKSDIETREAIGGLFREFVGHAYRYYVEKYGPNSPNVKLCRDGYYYEPSVAERIFGEMLTREKNIRVYVRRELAEVSRAGNQVTAIRVKARDGGEVEEFRGRAFIDATYEGDLAAFAGARYRLGREARSDFNELHAGVVYQNYDTRTFLAGTTGEGDKRIQAYTYRLCLSTDPANSRVLSQPPPEYDRKRYLGYIDDWKAGRLGPPSTMKEGAGYHPPTFNTVVRALSIAEIPNGKTDVNMNPRPLGFPFPEENYGYPEATWAEREKISARIRNITLGLLYFVQNDPDIPKEHRDLARRYNLAKDEFTDNQNFPWQLYVREARRIVGEYTLSENDVIVGPGLGRTKIHSDSIAAGEYPIDSFPARKREKGHDTALEGYLLMLANITRPYQVPFRIMVPEKTEGLLVPVAASTTHVAFSSIRLEPTWMALGQAAGTAAHLAIAGNQRLRAIDVKALQRLLLDQGQVLTYFKDIDRADPAYRALQYFGTQGFFRDYFARSREPLDRAQAGEWLAVTEPEKSRLARIGTAPGIVTKSEAAEIYRAMGIERRQASGGRPDEPVTRGEFCTAIYESLAFEQKPLAKPARREP